MKRLISLSLLSLFTFSSTALASFSDTAGYKWASSIDYIQSAGIVNGYDDGTFRPSQQINRAEFMKVVMEGFFDVSDSYARDCFTDVKESDWFAKYICMGKDLGIVNGHPDGRFDPSSNVSQPEALKIIFNVLSENVVDEGGEWYQQYLDHAEKIGMYYFNVNSPAAYKLPRGEAAYFIAWLVSPDWDDQISESDFYSNGKSPYFDFHQEELSVD